MNALNILGIFLINIKYFSLINDVQKMYLKIYIIYHKTVEKYVLGERFQFDKEKKATLLQYLCREFIFQINFDGNPQSTEALNLCTSSRSYDYFIMN